MLREEREGEPGRNEESGADHDRREQVATYEMRALATPRIGKGALERWIESRAFCRQGCRGRSSSHLANIGTAP